MMPDSCLYVGQVVHRRLRPRPHHLRYPCYWLFLDVDRLSAVAEKLRFLSIGRFNLFSLKEADYGIPSRASLGEQARELLIKAGVDCEGCRIFLLTIPRVLGYAFNPLSIYCCYAADGALRGAVYEVHNTFGQRHNYAVAFDSCEQRDRHTVGKDFYVSPFLDMALSYKFHFSEPKESVRLVIRTDDAEGPVLMASLTGRRECLSDEALMRLFIRLPLLTFQVIGGIHWEAFRLWLKGVPLVPRPPRHEPSMVSQLSATAKVMHE